MTVFSPTANRLALNNRKNASAKIPIFSYRSLFQKMVQMNKNAASCSCDG